MADGLSRTYATRIVLGWANPKKWWQGIKFIRDELVGGILSKSFATTIVLEHSNPKAWWNMVKEIIGKIVLLNPALTQKELYGSLSELVLII